MSMFGKMKCWAATCYFCRDQGSCIAAPNLSGQEIAICPSCANKLIVGIDIGMKELQRLEAEKEKGVTAPIEIVTSGPKTEPSA